MDGFPVRPAARPARRVAGPAAGAADHARFPTRRTGIGPPAAHREDRDPPRGPGDPIRREPGETPLPRAAGEDAGPTVIQALLAAGAELDARDEYGWTPLHRAAHNLNRTVVPVLAAFGVDLEARNADGSTPFHLAAEQFRLRGKPVTVEALPEAGADPDAHNDNGQTPLHRATPLEHDGPGVVEALLSAGADRRARDAAGATPADYAEDGRALRMLTAASSMGFRRRPSRSPPAHR